MTRYALGRLATALPILALISLFTFWAADSITNPTALIAVNPRITAADRAAYVEALGLDLPFWQRYFAWLGNFVTGDLGTSLVQNGAEVWPMLRTALANTLVLLVVAVTASLLIGIAVGTLGAVRRGSLLDYAATTTSFFGLSIPVFWLGLMLQLFFGLYFANWLGVTPPLLPTAGLYSPGQVGFDLVDRARHLALPAMALSLQLVAAYSRYMRSSLLDALGAEYVRTAYAKGLSERAVVLRHGVRNALIPVTTLAALDIGLLVGGLIVTERVFQYPGMGTLFFDAIHAGDYAVLLPVVMLVSGGVFVMSFAADLLYGVLDPRIRRGTG
ncbi:ABC transporter permease [Candidatus Poriferisodalis sp.]|uniref:ABC transporter permease n=1 Tax=Candidatus Poriferisodalis sp. TaxID=3101277 RepID=UPI003B017E06